MVHICAVWYQDCSHNAAQFTASPHVVWQGRGSHAHRNYRIHLADASSCDRHRPPGPGMGNCSVAL